MTWVDWRVTVERIRRGELRCRVCGWKRPRYACGDGTAECGWCLLRGLEMRGAWVGTGG